MARQRIHNSRAGRTSNSGASWISYSDMMAALLLVFVLILCISLHQYFLMLDQKTRELDDQRALVSAQQLTLDRQTLQLASQQTELDYQRSQIIIIQTDLDAKAEELENTRIILADQEAELEEARTALADRENELIILQTELDNQRILLGAQQAALDEQTGRIDDLVGMRTRIIADLSNELAAARIRATVDPNTGDIVLDSAVLFQTNSSSIMPEGRALLDQFIPLYLSVLLKPEYSDYLGQIIIEGHTDTAGDYIANLELSQNRALSVAKYVLAMPSLSRQQQELLQQILTSTGRSESDPIYNADGSVNMDASRRVEFKFSLKDAEMIEEMNRLLQQSGH